MYNSIPEMNRHTMQRMRQDHKHKHKDMIRNMKPSVDNSLPNSMFHPIVKAKKEQMIEGKFCNIQLNADLNLNDRFI